MKILLRIIFAIQILFVSSTPATSAPQGMTYRNPIIHADYSDPDVVASPNGKTFYLTASSFQCTPGLPILKSTDLVNWELVNYAIKAVPPAEVYTGISQHGNGVWAPSIRYHNGEYYIYWGDPDFGIFMVKSSDPEGEWSEPVLVKGGKGLIDTTPLWDDDGKAYLVNGWANSRIGFNNILTISEMNPDGTSLISEPTIVFDGNDGVNFTVEGPKLYKKDGFYYIFAPAGGVAQGWQLAMRSKNIMGPYEVRKVMEQGNSDINGPHQGGWVTDANGEDWFLHFQDKDMYGRVLHLNPMTWKDGWPVIGMDEDGDGIGEPVRTYPAPKLVNNVNSPFITPENITKHFQWHSNYDVSYGFPSANSLMRLYGHKILNDTINLWDVPNLWLMKFPEEEFTFTSDITVSSKTISEGASSGVVIMGRNYCRLGLTSYKEGFILQYVTNEHADSQGLENIKDITLLKPSRNYSAGNLSNMEISLSIRVKVNKEGKCTFSYSLDGKKYTDLPYVFQASEGRWIGAKIGFYSITPSTVNNKGWIDINKISID